MTHVHVQQRRSSLLWLAVLLIGIGGLLESFNNYRHATADTVRGTGSHLRTYSAAAAWGGLARLFAEVGDVPPGEVY